MPGEVGREELIRVSYGIRNLGITLNVIGEKWIEARELYFL